MQHASLEGKKIMVVDDDEDIRRLLSYNLESAGAKVWSAPNGNDAIEIAFEQEPHMILLDVMLPDIDGIEVCEQIRSTKNRSQPLIVMISARAEDYSQLAGYQAGADDYIVKPVRIKVLLKKLEVLFSRGALKVDSFRTLEVDKEKFIVKLDNGELLLPKKEFELLTYLMDNAQKVCKRAEILENVWGGSVIGDRTIDVHVRKLREKIGKEIILTLKGVGYKFNPIY